MKAASTSITAGWRLGESRATCSSARMPPIRPSCSAQPSCSSAWAQRPVTCPARDRARLRAVNTSAPVASSPAPSASTRPRAASRAVGGRGRRAGPASWCASQPLASTSTPAAGASLQAAIPPGVHRRPRRRASHHFITGKTLGEHARLRGPFRRQRRHPGSRRSSCPGTPEPGSGRDAQAQRSFCGRYLRLRGVHRRCRPATRIGRQFYQAAWVIAVTQPHPHHPPHDRMR